MKKKNYAYSDIVIYAAGPIDLGSDIPNWRQILINDLKELNVVATVFDPSTAFKLSKRGHRSEVVDTFIEHVNNTAMQYANLVVAVIPSGVTTIGTPIEIDTAAKNMMRVMLITDIPYGTSIYLNNRIPRDDWYYVEDIKDAEATINKLAFNIATSLLYTKD